MQFWGENYSCGSVWAVPEERHPLHIPSSQCCILEESSALLRKPKKGDNDNFCLHLWELWMPHLKYLSTVAN